MIAVALRPACFRYQWLEDMARNRMLNPEFWLDEEIATLSPHARLLYMGLWGICDDNYATFPNKPAWIKIQVFPYESVSTRELLDELEKIGKIIKFTAEDTEWYWIKNFFKHQRVDRPSRPKYPKFGVARVLLDDGSTRARPEVKEVSKVNKGDSFKKVGDFVRGGFKK